MGDAALERGAGVAAIVLAAGESSRMGEPKALLDWGGKVLVQHQIDELTTAGCNPVVVVLGHDARRIAEAISCEGACRVVINEGYQEGRASSVRVGAEAVPDGAEAVVVASVDQPCRAGTVRALIESYRAAGGAIVVPRYEGRNGHPALFASELIGDLRAVAEASEGLRAVRRREAAGTRFLDIDDAWVRLDLNTPEDYAAASEARAAPDG
jgi:CTP:molybdopterin cytidylyltransferase MocA